MVLNDALFRLQKKQQQCERNEVWVTFIFLRNHACLHNVTCSGFSWPIMAQPITSQTVADDGTAAREMHTCMQIWLEGVP